MYLLYVCLFLAGKVLSEKVESRLLELDQGPVLGYKDPTEDLYAFYGIPYASAPTGKNKFKPPLPGPKWSKPLEAVDKGIICPQHNYFGIVNNMTTMQENCLIANVFIPNTDETNLPVFVYVHGGAFILGYGKMSSPKKLVSSKRVIVVTFNYRLGPHGFLCLGTKDIPGNSGMKDQVALLRWVNKNIKHFGGNPEDVTIAGCSAGGSSVGLLMISKLARGLFSKVIPESGDVTSPFSVQVNPIQNAIEYAKLLNFSNVDDLNVLESFYKNATYELLISPVILKTDSSFIVTPCVERDVGEEIFLEDDPYSLIRNGIDNVPMLYGYTNMDGLMQISLFDEWKERMNSNFEDFLPPDLSIKTEKERNIVAQKIKTFYFGSKTVENDTVMGYVNYFTDTMFACPTLRTIQLLLKTGNKNIYLYEYSYVDDMTSFVPYTNIKGAGHCGQTTAIFDGRTHDRTYNIVTSDENLLTNEFKNWKSVMRDIWLNFITQGKPESFLTPHWVPVYDNGLPYMALKQSPELRKYHVNTRCLFWDEIYEKYYQKPVPPSTNSKVIEDVD